MVLVYRSATVYMAATRVITVRQYSLKPMLTFSEDKNHSGDSNTSVALALNVKLN